jgi:hypothetical protein
VLATHATVVKGDAAKARTTRVVLFSVCTGDRVGDHVSTR